MKNNNNIIVLLFFLITLSCSSLFLTARAQSPLSIASSKDITTTTTRATLPLPLSFIIFVFAFIITGFFAIYTRYCSPTRHHALPHPTRRGIDPRVLATCPLIPYLKTKPFRQNGESQCSVCLAEFADGDALRLLPRCGHVFHAPCIDAWLAAHVTCPVCRDEVGAETEGEARVVHVFDESCVRERGEEGGVGKKSEEVKMLRSHSTGHSLDVENGEQGSVVITMQRSVSYDVVLRSVE